MSSPSLYQNAENDEEGQLLGDASTSARSSSSGAISKMAKMVLAGLAAVGLMAVALIQQPETLTNLTDVDVTDLGVSLFGSPYTKYTGNNQNNNNIIYLDRHNIDCGNDIIKYFKVEHGLKYKYKCMASQIGARTGAWGYNTGWQNAGPNIYLDRQHVWCPANTYLTRFQGGAKNRWGWKFIYRFTCSAYPTVSYSCSHHYTGWNDKGNSIIYLDRHTVSCPNGKGLNGFELQTSWWRVRYHYKCCSSVGANPTPAPISHPTHAPVANPTHLPTHAPAANPTHAPSMEPTHVPTEAPVANPTQNPTLEPISVPTEAPIAKPTMEPTTEPSMHPVANPTALPTEEPSVAPTQAPVAEVTAEPTYEATLLPTISEEGLVQPKNMSNAEWEDLVEHENEKHEVAEVLPEPAEVLDGGAAAPDSPVVQEIHDHEDAIVEEAINKKNESKAEAEAPVDRNGDGKVDLAPKILDPAAPSPNKPLESGSDDVLMCAYTFTKEDDSFTPVQTGCVLISDENIDTLQIGQTSNAGLICGMNGQSTIELNWAKIQEFEVIYRGGISFVKPGQKTSAEFFSSTDMTGEEKYTFTSGYHPHITNGALNGVIFNDNIKSMIIKSTATAADFTNNQLPSFCSK